MTRGFWRDDLRGLESLQLDRGIVLWVRVRVDKSGGPGCEVIETDKFSSNRFGLDDLQQG